jgi:hypothetical protein
MVPINPFKLELLERVAKGAGGAQIDGVDVAEICAWASWVVFAAYEEQQRPVPPPEPSPQPEQSPSPSPTRPSRPADSGYWDGL